MAVALDVVGPSSAGASSASSPLAWSHTCGASATELLAGISADSSADSGLSSAATYNAVGMSSLLRWESGGSGQTVGFLQLYRMASPPTGAAHNVSDAVTGTGTFSCINGGSLSFTGSAALSSAVHADSAGVSVTAGTITVPTASASNMVAVFVCNGSGGLTFTAGTLRFSCNGAGTGAAAFLYAATIPATGSPVAVTWTQTSDFYAAIGVEIQVASASGTGNAAVAAGSGAALNASVVTSNINVGPNYAGAAADLGGNYGAWATPQFATGGP